MRAKGVGTFTPLRPLLTRLGADDLAISSRVNGKVTQDSRARTLLFDVPTLTASARRVMILLPDHVAMFGTLAHPPKLARGAAIEIAIENMPTLRDCCLAEHLLSGIAARVLDPVT